jgi:pyruvate dehydrogenase E1 component
MLDVAKGQDLDPIETQEWLEALEAVLEREGPERAHFLLEQLIDTARRSGAYLPFSANTAYLNTIPAAQEERSPGDPAIEWRLRSFIRWNAMAMVVRANRISTELGGHIASFGSAATRGSMRAPFWKDAYRKSVCASSARKWMAKACRRIPIPG